MTTHDQRCYEDAFEQRQRDYYTEQALKDCTEAVNHADNEVTAKILADIGNMARWLLNNGDLDDKIAFPEFVFSQIANLIMKYAFEKAELDFERRERER